MLVARLGVSRCFPLGLGLSLRVMFSRYVPRVWVAHGHIPTKSAACSSRARRYPGRRWTLVRLGGGG